MATDESFAQMVADNMSGAGRISYRKMFGEYGIYCDGVLVALACDNQLYLKPTEEGRAYLVGVTEASPYPGAKASYLIEDGLDDREWLSGLVRVTYAGLSAAPPRRPRGGEGKQPKTHPKKKR